ncbi:hypothetical protein W97_02963 [Coniosporium apollinis CBS 100218]|uniref:Uncharacterized protein n=1 Tax=Coniosporium apollinis (strain CBS 100218) TaxID=1168221 RepID=R7YP77_CONA1|nr:uncharacterized protein W97_02963 [Coniosporium apollinis CBS 100218]EON63735.1 hypothetical protein W97_02963 [Coniosporium apollinis CBS 100218]
MEPASLATGIVALAGLFNNAIDCFEYVQLGRSFGKNFQTSLLKLDSARLRLSRWGEAVGLSGDLSDVRSLQQTLRSAQDVAKADAILGQVLDLFADAEGVSVKFKSRAKPGDQSLLVYDSRTELEPVTASLHERMRELSLKRQSRTGLRQKAKWAMYEEKQFRRLIEDITELVDNLVELFPAAQASQRRLCEVEVSEIGAEESLPVLKEIVANQDRYLEAAVSKALESRKGGSPNVVFSGNNNSGFQSAINYGTINSRWGAGAK